MNGEQTEQFLNAILLRALGKERAISSFKAVSGGCINNGLKVTTKGFNTSSEIFFIKYNDESVGDLFDQEITGLQTLRKHSGFTVPEVISSGIHGTRRYLILEWIDSKPPKSNFWEEFGAKLALMHRQTDESFGFGSNNYIGKLPQNNDRKENWIDFFIENRLEAQLGLAIYNDRINRDFAKRFRYIYSQLPGILTDEAPSLLHGDLWSGNFMSDSAGNACLFDPAVYYGNREIEIAFTKLFGGFDRQFYNAYQEAFPMEPGFEERADIYNLYPLLVHVNLFGDSYLPGIEMVMRRYC